MDETFDIRFDDLKPEVQAEFLEFMGLKDAAEGNFDVYPIAEVPKPEEV